MTGTLSRFCALRSWPACHYVYRQPWTIRQYAGFSTAKNATLFIAVTWPPAKKVFPLRLTLPPPVATTPITPRVAGDVGKAGVAIDAVEDMKVLLDRIPLDKMSVSMTMNRAVLPGTGVLYQHSRRARCYT
ncbi:methylmalonyl-CoA mutase family protein [Escherichia coli]